LATSKILQWLWKNHIPINRTRIIPYAKNVQEIHSLKLNFVHTSKEKSKNPISTKQECGLPKNEIKTKKNFFTKWTLELETWKYTPVQPLEIIYPPRAITTNMAKDPKVLATIIFRPKDPIKRNRPIDIWCRKKKSKNCRKNLQIQRYIEYSR